MRLSRFALLAAPLWATYPTYELRRALRFAAAFAIATALAFSILLLEPSLGDALRDRIHGVAMREHAKEIQAFGGHPRLDKHQNGATTDTERRFFHNIQLAISFTAFQKKYVLPLLQ